MPVKLLVLLWYTLGPGHQSDDAYIRYVRAEVGKINAGTTYKTVTRPTGESAEGGTITYSLAAGRVAKIVAVAYGEAGKNVEEYYFKENRLLFVFATTIIYGATAGSPHCVSECRQYIKDQAVYHTLAQKPDCGQDLCSQDVTERAAVLLGKLKNVSK